MRIAVTTIVILDVPDLREGETLHDVRTRLQTAQEQTIDQVMETATGQQYIPRRIEWVDVKEVKTEKKPTTILLARGDKWGTPDADLPRRNEGSSER